MKFNWVIKSLSSSLSFYKSVADDETMPEELKRKNQEKIEQYTEALSILQKEET